MNTLEFIVVFLLLVLLPFWKHLVVIAAGFYEDYQLWRDLRTQNLISKSFWEYRRDEC